METKYYLFYYFLFQLQIEISVENEPWYNGLFVSYLSYNTYDDNCYVGTYPKKQNKRYILHYFSTFRLPKWIFKNFIFSFYLKTIVKILLHQMRESRENSMNTTMMIYIFQ